MDAREVAEEIKAMFDENEFTDLITQGQSESHVHLRNTEGEQFIVVVAKTH